jgi:hypothetical protein
MRNARYENVERSYLLELIGLLEEVSVGTKQY